METRPVFKVWKLSEGSKIPIQAHDTDTGWDVCAEVDFILPPKKLSAVPLGIVVKAPEGYYIELYPRSSLFKKHKCVLANSVGIVDGSFSGPNDKLMALLYNTSSELQHIEAGERILQMVPRKRLDIDLWDMTGQPFETGDRGGLGSTGEK